MHGGPLPMAQRDVSQARPIGRSMKPEYAPDTRPEVTPGNAASAASSTTTAETLPIV